MRPVILDTDIGSDVDDILALVMLAKAPELQLIGITTVYGDTIHRARIAKATCAMLQRPEIRIVAGAPKPISGRQVYWAGHEGEGISDLETFSIETSIKAEEYLATSAEESQGELEILAIGPLTNIAKAIQLSGQFKMLKKTSATLLRNHPTYSGLEGVFLDHAPRSMSDKHYAQVPTELLSEAIQWLHGQYKFPAKTPKSAK